MLTNIFPATAVVQPKTIHKLAYINALRGIAILLVIMVHVLLISGTTGAGVTKLPVQLVAFGTNGAYGVQLFFIASAYTLFRSMARRTTVEKHATLNFFLRRFFRIAPLYYLGIVVYVLWLHYADKQVFFPLNVASHFVFLHGLRPFWIQGPVPGGWSITCEMMFYVLVPLLFRYVSNLNKAIWFLILTILVNTAFEKVLRHWPLIDLNQPNGWLVYDTWLKLYLINQLPVFALGIIFYFLTVEESLARLNPRTLLVLACVLLASIFTNRAPTPPSTDIPYLSNSLWVSVGWVLFALALSRWAAPFFVNRFTQWIGEISYSLYIVHFLVIFVLNKFNYGTLIQPATTGYALANFFVRLVLVTTLSVLIAYILYHTVEKYGQRIGTWLIALLEAR